MSIQFIHYLRFSYIEFIPSLWLYSIHGANAEIILILEENHIDPPDEDNSYEACLEEAINNHHNNIANYIQDNLLNQKVELNYLQNKFNNNEIINFLFSKNEYRIGAGLFKNCTKMRSIEIPSNITSFKRALFNGCSSLLYVKISNSTVTIEPLAFQNCISLKTIEIPSSVKSICSSLDQIAILSAITSIESFTFYGCSSLVHIIIHSSVTYIGVSAFYGCSSMADIKIN